MFPRLADPVDISDYALDPVRQSSGVAALDGMLADGYWQGASTLCAGPSGCGKTLMGLHFVFNGVRQGEPGVLASEATFFPPAAARVGPSARTRIANCISC